MIRTSVKRLVRSIYVMRCGYCYVSEEELGAQMTYDHFKPQSQGGTDNKDNLVYACHACNKFKGEYWGDTEETSLLHPLQDDLETHLHANADGTMQAITSAGERYLRILQLNRAPLVLRRRNYLPIEQTIVRDESIIARLDMIEERIERIEKRSRSATKIRRRIN